jgi:hypothetical protein
MHGEQKLNTQKHEIKNKREFKYDRYKMVSPLG